MQTQTQIEENLLRVARTIRKGIKNLASYGEVPRSALCGLFVNALGQLPEAFLYDSMGRIKDIMQGWPDGTGCRVFPVPATRGDRDEDAAQDAYMDLPHWEDEQLVLRLELLDYIIEQLEESTDASK